MKKIILSLLLIASSGCAEEKIVATIDGKPLHENAVKAKIENFIQSSGIPKDQMDYNKLDEKAKEAIIKTMVVGDLILDEARKSKLDASKEFQEAKKFVEDQLLQKTFMDNLAKKNVSDQMVKEKYDQLLSDYKDKDEYKASHILVATEAEAKKIKAKLDKGEDFAKLAKENSLDGNKNEGGSLEYFSEGQMVEPFEKAIKSMKIGTISNPIKTEFGYHIIKLENKRKMTPPTFENMKDKIKQLLTNEYIKTYVEKLMSEHKVEFSKS